MPGHVVVTSESAIATLLGSCVSVCLIDPELRLIGMNHFLLPQVRKHIGTKDASLAGMAAMENLVNAMMKRGANKARLQAKAFGGAHVLNLPSIKQSIAPGERNIHFTREWLSAEKIPLVAMDLGGQVARKIVADPATGQVHCRHISRAVVPNDTLLRVEIEYSRKLELELDKRHIDFF